MEPEPRASGLNLNHQNQGHQELASNSAHVDEQEIQDLKTWVPWIPSTIWGCHKGLPEQGSLVLMGLGRGEAFPALDNMCVKMGLAERLVPLSSLSRHLPRR